MKAKKVRKEKEKKKVRKDEYKSLTIQKKVTEYVARWVYRAA